MSAHSALVAAGIVFGIVAIMHVFRLIYKTDVVVAGKPIPMWGSVVGLIVSALLCIWMFMVSNALS